MRTKWLQFDNWSIRDKLILHILLISIFPALCLGLLISWATSYTIEEQVNGQTSQLIGNVNKSLDYHASNMQNVSYLISFNSEIGKFFTEGASAFPGEQERYNTLKFLQGFTTLHSEIAGIMVVNHKGEYLSNEMYARTSRNLTEENWYQDAVKAKGIFKLVGHPVKRNVTSHANYKDEEVVSFVRAVLDPETQAVQGVVLIDFKSRLIAEVVRDVRLGKSGYLIVMDDKGDALYAPKNSIVDQLDRERILTDNAGDFAEKVDGKPIQYIYQKSSFTGWTTVGVFPMQERIQGINEINLYIVSFVFLVSLLGIAASYYLSYSISRPIIQLSSFMHKVENGNMSIRYNGKRRDEIGMLGNSFNQMLAQIKRLLRQVNEEQRLKREAELRSLQAHIQPHFLYNTLDTIQWLARKDGAYEATEVVESLSRLFRIGLSRGKEIIPLADEFEHIRSYLMIQKTRYKDKLNYSIDIEPELMNLFVIKLILQPIVENAIYHGIKERRGPGFISIRATAEEGMVVIRIEDDGNGMTEDKLSLLRTQLDQVGKTDYMQPTPQEKGEEEGGPLKSYGLRNVQERIRLSYGEPYGISIDSQWKSGTVVTIRHPIMNREE
ncbi:sensor histidine kinase [Paenibacillus motobuensis]|uniref:cache domain-containing sensor histidine kinase n=1 Tax=Paenibacillus TaxID=44249 RepID=UPI00203BD6FC|nr:MULTISPECIES: sensor histidine kinase [Paenibacillus]MCM3042965.1 sensor histidine kinase [Paenibacillus lutimineralis]MCM3650069.1 sensor histidine kinase [Paenibacillus motobuensis]